MESHDFGGGEVAALNTKCTALNDLLVVLSAAELLESAFLQDCLFLATMQLASSHHGNTHQKY
eukprot:3405764-Rhodomonas_salina.1